jgi:hypothetical protein
MALVHGAELLHVAPSRRATSAHWLPLHKLVVPLDGGALRREYSGCPVEYRGPVLVGANALQSMACDGPSLAVFVAPIAPDGRGVWSDVDLRRHFGRSPTEISSANIQAEVVRLA